MPVARPVRSPADDFTDHCLELLAGAGTPRALRMFGGHGIYLDGLFVAIVTGNRLYLKADDTTRPRFEAEGCEPFRYEAKGRGVTALNYFSAPQEAIESPALMRPWARLALEAALRANAAKAPKAAPRRPAAKKRKA